MNVDFEFSSLLQVKELLKFYQMEWSSLMIDTIMQYNYSLIYEIKLVKISHLEWLNEGQYIYQYFWNEVNSSILPYFKFQ